MCMTATTFQYARRRAGLSQRELAERADIAQPSIARIERGLTSPRLDTARRFLEACGFHLTIEARPGLGVDRTAMREMLVLSPRQRLELAVRDAQGLSRLTERLRVDLD